MDALKYAYYSYPENLEKIDLINTVNGFVILGLFHIKIERVGDGISFNLRDPQIQKISFQDPPYTKNISPSFKNGQNLTTPIPKMSKVDPIQKNVTPP